MQHDPQLPADVDGDRQRTVDQRRFGGLRASLEGFGHGGGAADFGERAEPLRGSIGAKHHVGIQHREQSFEVAVARGLEEGVDDVFLPVEIGVRRRRALYPPAGAAGQLPRRSGRAADDRGDLLERHGKHVVQHEGQPFGRRQGFQHHQQRGADGIGHLRIAPMRIICDRFRHMRAHRFLAPRFARAQHVEADTGDDGGQPAAEVFDRLVSERLSRSQVSCTASSTSLVEPSMR